MARKNKKEVEFVNYWNNEIRDGRAYMDKYSRKKSYDDYRRYYRNEWPDDIIPVNRIFSFGRSLIPQVYFRNPRVCVTPTRPELVPHAMVVEAIDNWLIHELNLKQEIKRSILNAYLCGTSPMKLGFDSEFGFNPLQSVDQDSGTVTQIGTKGEMDGKAIEYNVNIRPGMPWAQTARPESIIIPWGYRDSNALPWIAHEIYRPLDDIKADQKYRNTKNLAGTSFGDRYKNASRPPLRKKEDDMLYGLLLEIRDLRTNEVIVLCEDKLLLQQEDALQIEGHNYDFLTFNEDPEYFWGIPDVSILEPQQLELNETRTQAADHRRIALLKFFVLEGAISPEDMEAFLSGEVGPVVKVSGENISNAIMQFAPHIPPDLRGEAMALLGDMQLGIGYNENASGSFKEGTPPSAAETQLAGQVGEMRTSERQDLVHEHLVNIVRKWNQYIFSFWTGERVAQITGPQGTQMWIQYTAEQLKGEYSLSVNADSAMPVTRDMKRQMMDGMVKHYGGDPMINQLALRQKHLQQYEWALPGLSSLITPPQIPGMDPAAAAHMRQPNPMNAGGGQGGPSPNGRPPGQGGQPPGGAHNPINFERFQKGAK